MSFFMDCPNCNKKLRIRKAWKGRTIRCPACKQQFSVNPPDPPPEPAPAASAQTAEWISSIGEYLGWTVLSFAGIWLIYFFLSSCPRISFWILMPLIVFILIGAFDQLNRFIFSAALAGLIFWGLYAHNIIAGKYTKSLTAAETTQSEISISVKVSRKYFLSEGYVFTDDCEYKLYADDQCVATRNTTRTSVQFHVKVKKGSRLRAEMTSRGVGFSKTLEAPQQFEREEIAMREGQVISLECW